MSNEEKQTLARDVIASLAQERLYALQSGDKARLARVSESIARAKYIVRTGTSVANAARYFGK